MLQDQGQPIGLPEQTLSSLLVVREGVFWPITVYMFGITVLPLSINCSHRGSVLGQQESSCQHQLRHLASALGQSQPCLLASVTTVLQLYHQGACSSYGRCRHKGCLADLSQGNQNSKEESHSCCLGRRTAPSCNIFAYLQLLIYRDMNVRERAYNIIEITYQN